MQFEIVKYALTQGGLTLVCLVVFYFYRRDFLTKIEDQKADKALLIDLVEKNTRAHMRLVGVLDRRLGPDDRRMSGDGRD